MLFAVNSIESTRFQSLQQRLHEALAIVSLTSEAARREVLVAPILLEVAHATQATINIEYRIEVNQYLCGDLDYYLRSSHNLLVIEAKQADLTRGFTQLAVELIALAQWLEKTESVLYGAVTTGDIWLFGCYEINSSQIIQDLALYRVPADLELVIKALVGILQAEKQL